MSQKSFFNVPFILLTLVLLCLGEKAHAQDWTKLGTLPFNVRCGYFWDFYHGVVAGEYGMYWYNNGTWTKSKYPESPGLFTAVRQLSPGKLYATQGATQVWVSVDSGKSWDTTGVHAGQWWFNVYPDSGQYWRYADFYTWTASATPPPPNQKYAVFAGAQDVYMTSDGKIKTVPGRLFTIQVPAEDRSLQIHGGSFAQLDQNHLVISYRDTGTVIKDTGVPYYSKDGGLTWNRSKGMNEMGGFGCFADTCQHIYFTAAENGSAYFSADSGVTWQLCGSQLDGGAGDMDVLDGANGTLYKQTVSAGVFQSVDGGASWQWIARSPKGIVEDTHILPVGSYGSEMVVFSGHNVWYVTGANFNSRPASPISVADSTLHECYPTAAVPVLIRPTGIRHKMHFLTEGDSTHLLLPNDTTILTPAHDSIVFLFHITPPDVHGATSLRIHSHIGDNCFPLDWDTTFVDTIASSAFAISAPSTTSLLACDSAKLPIAIYSSLCDSFALTSIQILGDSEHRISLSPVSRHPLAPGEMDTVWLKYIPHGVPDDRMYSVRLSGTLAPSNIPIDTVLKLHVTALPDKRCNQDTTKAMVGLSPSAPMEFRITGKSLSFSIESPHVAESAGIVNVLGGVVLRRTRPEQTMVGWDLNTLPSGVYFLRVSCEGTIVTKRFILGD